MRGAWAFAAAAAMSLVLGGCSTFEYLAQAGCGQVDLGVRSRKLGDVLHDKKTSPEVRTLLAEVPEIKRYAEAQGLTPTKSYKSFTDVHRSAVVWVVGASEPLSFKPKTWSFPIVGSVPYLGWFNRDDAKDFADGLRGQGYDVDLRGASAYSTLGWFEDPILSTMLGSGDEAVGDLANVVLHESVHATYYVPGQSALNESVADFLGDRLATAYLISKAGDDSEELRRYAEGQRIHERRAAAFHTAYDELAELYASSKSDAEKLAEKEHIVRRLRADTGFHRPINNATLHGYEVYNSGKAELEALYTACGDKASRLLASLHQIGPASFKKTQDQDIARVLAPLVRAKCPLPAKAHSAITARR